MTSDIFHVHDHSTDVHMGAIVMIAHHLRRRGYTDVRTTDRLPHNDVGVQGPEIDISAWHHDMRIDPYGRKTNIDTKIGIEVEDEPFNKQNLINKWDKYRGHGIKVLYVVVFDKVRGKKDFGADGNGNPRDIRVYVLNPKDLAGTCRGFAEAVL